jgi:hypothetical protein
MADLESANQKLILTHAALAGLTPLIPIPFADDMAKDYLQRRMIKALGDTRGVVLSAEGIAALGDDEHLGWKLGAAKAMVLYPLKKILRKTFIFLSAKRTVDAASECFHRGFLADYAFERRFCAPAGPRRPAEVRAAIDAVCREVTTAPIEHALKAGFAQSKIALQQAGDLFQRIIQARGWPAAPEKKPEDATPPPADEVARVVEAVANEDARGVEGIVAQLRKAIAQVPDEHFEELRRRLEAKLGAPASGAAKPSA